VGDELKEKVLCLLALSQRSQVVSKIEIKFPKLVGKHPWIFDIYDE
jgi:hypothetical protein